MNCPTCKSPIEPSCSQCEWCGKSIINSSIEVISEQATNIPNLDFQILELCRNGNKLAAVKLKKDNSSLGLSEAKDYVDNLCRINIKEDTSSSGCFIATACYGDYESPEVIEFRKFRDDVLLRNYFGRQFVSMYYFISPPIAKSISNSENSKRFLRFYLFSPILTLIKK
jgi:hypothetical protein